MSQRHTHESNPTVFGKILRGEIPSTTIYEDEFSLAFTNIHPEAKVHIVFIPKTHIPWLRNAAIQDQSLLGHLLLKVPEVAKAAGIYNSGYRVIINDGPDSNGEVPHLHLHILGGQNLGTKIV